MSNLINSYRYAGGGGLAGITHYWNMDGNSNDSVGVSNGTDTSITYPATGIINDAADLTASTSSVINVGSDSSLSFGNGTTETAFTFTFWINFNVLGATSFIMKNTPNTEWFIRFQSGRVYFRIYDGSAWIERRTGNIGAVAATWKHIAVTYDASATAGGINIYRDGSLLNDTTASSGTYVATNDTASDVTFGNGASGAFNGSMDEIYILDRELDATEVQFCYDEGIAGRTLI